MTAAMSASGSAFASGSTVQIRPAVVEDAAQIAEVHVRSWQGAYRGLIPQDYLDGLDPASWAEGRARSISQIDWARSACLVAADSASVVGFAHVGPTRDAGEDRDLTGEVMAIYVTPDAWSTGCGRELMSVALRRLAEAGYRQATLWVLDTNARARRFYERAGFEPDGGVQSDDRGAFQLREVRYRRALP
ncbi:MAG TPA: GNAT family N-acetyltransferase [Streptosporangiaceae bacterium]|nr:GNAT family N-acetyltransferase [Streptosporangiaceae bacterium]